MEFYLTINQDILFNALFIFHSHSASKQIECQGYLPKFDRDLLQFILLSV